MPILCLTCYQFQMMEGGSCQGAMGREEEMKDEGLSAPARGSAGQSFQVDLKQALAFLQGHVPHLEFLLDAFGP